MFGNHGIQTFNSKQICLTRSLMLDYDCDYDSMIHKT